MGDWTRELSWFIGLLMVGAAIGLVAIFALIVLLIVWLIG